MLNGSLLVLFIVVAILAGVVVGFVLKQMFTAKKIKSSESLTARIVEEAKKEAETIKKEAILQAKENLLKMKADFDRETKEEEVILTDWKNASAPKKKIWINGSMRWRKKNQVLKDVKNQ